MVLIQRALPICAIASVLVRGYVLIAADVDDFKNLANTILSQDLANQLTGLVYESSHSHTRPTDEKVEVKFSDIGNTEKDKLVKAYGAPHSVSIKDVTYSPIDYNRRYRTVKNGNDERNNIEKNNIEKKILRKPNYANAKLGPRYVRDELEDLLQNMADHSYTNNKEKNNAESKLNEQDNIFSQEKREPTGLFDKIIDQNKNDHYSIFQKLDYTETKLGDWNYNPETTQNPVTIKNVKSGYTNRPDKNNNKNAQEKLNLEKQVSEEYDIFSNSWNDVDKTKTTQQGIVGLNNPVNHDFHISPQKVGQKEKQEYKPKETSFERLNSYESLQFDSKNKGSSANKAKKQQVVEYDNFQQDFLEPKHDNIRKEKSRPLSKKDFKFSFESENEFHDIIKDDKQQAEEYTTFNKHILEPKEKDIQKNIYKKPSRNGASMNDAHTSFINKASNKEKGTYQNKKESYNLEPKVKDIHNNKPRNQLIEENDIYEKHALNYKSDENDETKNHYQEIQDSDKNLGIKNKDQNQNEKKSYDLEPKDKDTHKRKPHKQLMEENDMYDKYALSYKSEDSHETKAYHQQTRDNANLKTNNKFKNKNLNEKESSKIEQKDKYDHNRKPYKQSMEENVKHDEYSLGHKLDVKHERNVYHQHTDIPDKKSNIRNKSTYKLSAPDEHKQYKSTSNERLFLKHKKSPNEKAPFKDNSEDHQFATKALKKQQFPDNSDDLESDAKQVEPGPIKANTEYFIDSNEFSNKPEDPTKALKKQQSPDNSDDLESNAKEVKPGPIKANTEYFIDSVENTNKPEDIKAKTENLLDTVEGNRKLTKKFTMKGTDIPKREFYKMSSPDYYHKLPRIVDKYDFGEPIPEKDRMRNKEKQVKREPAMINRKIRLSY